VRRRGHLLVRPHGASSHRHRCPQRRPHRPRGQARGRQLQLPQHRRRGKPRRHERPHVRQRPGPELLRLRLHPVRHEPRRHQRRHHWLRRQRALLQLRRGQHQPRQGSRRRALPHDASRDGRPTARHPTGHPAHRARRPPARRRLQPPHLGLSGPELVRPPGHPDHLRLRVLVVDHRERQRRGPPPAPLQRGAPEAHHPRSVAPASPDPECTRILRMERPSCLIPAEWTHMVGGR
jgi:hypothetical protein